MRWPHAATRARWPKCGAPGQRAEDIARVATFTSSRSRRRPGSFLSGHSATAFAAATAIAIARPTLRVWALAAAAVVAVSRVYLGMHYLGDVLAGALLGSAIGAGIVLLGRRALPSSMTRALRPA